MRTTKTTIWFTAFAVILATVAAPSATGENLGHILRESGWDRIIGTWVDVDTKGAGIKTAYNWKFKDRVVEVTSRAGNLESVSLMGLNAKTGEIYNLAADNQGGGSVGKWGIEDGDAILELAYVTGEGEEGGLRIRHHLKDDDTLVLTVELPEPVTFTLHRAEK